MKSLISQLLSVYNDLLLQNIKLCIRAREQARACSRRHVWGMECDCKVNYALSPHSRKRQIASKKCPEGYHILAQAEASPGGVSEAWVWPKKIKSPGRGIGVSLRKSILNTIINIITYLLHPFQYTFSGYFICIKSNLSFRATISSVNSAVIIASFHLGSDCSQFENLNLLTSLPSPIVNCA